MQTPKVAVKHEMVEVECVAEEYALIEDWCRDQGRTFQVLLQGVSTLEDGRMADCLYVETAPVNRPKRTRVDQFSFVVTRGLSRTREPQLPQRAIEVAAESGDWARVRTLCWDRLETRPDDGLGLYWLGQASRFLGDPGGALRAFEAALPRVPKGLGVRTSMAVFMAGQYQNDGDGERAMALMRRVVEVEPEEPSGWNTLGICQHRAGDALAAMASYENGLAACVRRVLEEARGMGLWSFDAHPDGQEPDPVPLNWTTWRLRGDRAFQTLLMNGWRILKDAGEEERAFRTLVRASLCRSGDDLSSAFDEHGGREPTPTEILDGDVFDRVILLEQWGRLNAAGVGWSSASLH
jgi:tetratricopeptide (TPR) repeat protein